MKKKAQLFSENNRYFKWKERERKKKKKKKKEGREECQVSLIKLQWMRPSRVARLCFMETVNNKCYIWITAFSAEKKKKELLLRAI